MNQTGATPIGDQNKDEEADVVYKINFIVIRLIPV